MKYSVVYYGHIGKYRCPNCGAARPEPAVRATSVTQHGTEGSELNLALPSGEVSLNSPMPGIYNLYNTLAAVATSTALGIDPACAREAVNNFSAAFGRIERIAVDGKQVFLALVKNPVGFGEVLRTVLADGAAKNLFIIINDKFADGTDISWLWDVDFELIRGRANFVVVSGIRAEDMAMRLKYAQVPSEQVFLEKDLRQALEKGSEHDAGGQHPLPAAHVYRHARGARDHAQARLRRPLLGGLGSSSPSATFTPTG